MFISTAQQRFSLLGLWRAVCSTAHSMNTLLTTQSNDILVIYERTRIALYTNVEVLRFVSLPLETIIINKKKFLFL